MLLLSILFFHYIHCRFKIRQPFNEQKSKEKDSYNITYEEEWEWIVDIIKRYTTITELVQNHFFFFRIFIIVLMKIYVDVYIYFFLCVCQVRRFDKQFI